MSDTTVNENQLSAAIAQLLNPKEVVVFRPDLSRKLGSISATLMLGQAIYWQGIAGNNQFFYKNMHAERDANDNIVAPSTSGHQSWEYELGGMKRKDQEAARELLVHLELIEIKKIGIPCRLHYKVDLAAVAKFIINSQLISDSGAPAVKAVKPLPVEAVTTRVAQIPTKPSETSSDFSHLVSLGIEKPEPGNDRDFMHFNKIKTDGVSDDLIVSAVKKIIETGRRAYVSAVTIELYKSQLPAKKDYGPKVLRFVEPEKFDRESVRKDNEDHMIRAYKHGRYDGDFEII